MSYPPGRGVRPPVVGPRRASVQLGEIDGGIPGTEQTLRKMAKLAREALRDPRVLETAARIARAAQVRDQVGQATALRAWVAQHTRYLNDPPGLELLRTPSFLLDRIGRDGLVEGDCDDMALLTAALGLAAGIAPRFVAVGFAGPGGPLTHVYTELLTPAGWQEMDVTRPEGRTMPTPTRRLLWRV